VSEPVLREASEADIPAICRLMRRAFPDNAKSHEEILRWQYWGNPYGPPVAWVWDDAGVVVGHHTCIRYAAMVEGKPATVGMGIDAAIDPDYQGRRLLTPLAKRMYNEAGKAGMPYTLSYPNDKSMRGIGRAGWQELGLLRTHLLMLDSSWFAKRAHVPRVVVSIARLALRAKPPRGTFTTTETSVPPADVDDLWNALQPAILNGVIRDSTWFEWRYLQRPVVDAAVAPYRYFATRRDGRLVGVAVTTQREQRGGIFTYLLEFLAVDDEAARSLLQVAAENAAGSVGVLLATLPGTSTSRLAIAAGLRLVPSRFEEKALHVGVVDNDGSHGDVAHMHWTLGWGDLDHL
jgi:GNAT acetyltransferase-like protein